MAIMLNGQKRGFANEYRLLEGFADGNERAPFTHPASLRSLALSSASGKEGEKGLLSK